MKFIAIVSGLTVLLALAAFVAVAMIDVPVTQKQITRTISNDTFYNKGSVTP